MDDDELSELEDPESWDWDDVQIHQPVANRFAVVSVTLTRDDFQTVAAAARARGMTLTQFVRSAAMKASGMTAVDNR
jgi:hypothetical protein